LSKSRQSGYYKAVRRISSLISSNEKELNEILDGIIRNVARPMESAASLLLLDSEHKKLIHVSSWGLPKTFILKGILDPEQSLKEVVTGEPVIIPDVTVDERIQYPEVVNKSGIKSVMAVPIVINNSPAGSIRVYTRQVHDFTRQDLNFVTTVANLTSIAINDHILRDMTVEMQKETYTQEDTSTISHARSPVFAHPSEKEFSQILEFYNIEWVYDPHSFPISWENDRITEMFTPDFYLPEQDLYVELTTLRPQLSSNKNRKLKRMQELYPEVNIKLFKRREIRNLMIKYGLMDEAAEISGTKPQNNNSKETGQQ